MKERIKQVRKALNLTQRAFAEQLKMKQNTIATYEMGRAIPSDPTINSICREFGINEKWLRTGEGEMFDPASVDHLEILVRKRHLTHNDYVLMEKFINLKPESRRAVMDYITEVVKEMTSSESSKFPSNEAVAAAMAPVKAAPPVELVGNSDKVLPMATSTELTAQLVALKHENEQMRQENEKLKQENEELKERERQAILRENAALKEVIAQDDAKPFGLSPMIPAFSSKTGR